MLKKFCSEPKIAGENLFKVADYLVVGESIPGGTTTALGVLLAMSIDAKGKVGSSTPNNPHELKIRAVEKVLKAAKVEFGALAKTDRGDIMCCRSYDTCLCWISPWSRHKVPVLMAGGTQMGTVLAVVKAFNPYILSNVAIGTTRWIKADKNADLKGIIAQIADIPISAADLDFSQSRYEGLKAYESGAVKEGMGAGESVIAAIAKSKGRISKAALLKEIERNYERLVVSG